MYINTKTLRLIAKEMGNRMTGTSLIELLQESGVPKEKIIYPNTKWRMLNDIFVILTNSNSRSDLHVLMKILTEYVHPLNLNGNLWESENTINRWNGWLEFDGWKIEKYGAGYIFNISDTVAPDVWIEDMMKASKFSTNDEANRQKTGGKIVESLIQFNEKNSVLKINEIEIPIPYTSNQYYLCKCIVKKRSKRWEYDELLDEFGMGDSDIRANRKVYDAMLAVNKKVFEKTNIKQIIKYDRKTFQFNPKLASFK